jgi:hypothetical protein
MQPMSDFVEMLLSTDKVPLEKIRYFSCDHIIPDEVREGDRRRGRERGREKYSFLSVFVESFGVCFE